MPMNVPQFRIPDMIETPDSPRFRARMLRTVMRGFSRPGRPIVTSRFSKLNEREDWEPNIAAWTEFLAKVVAWHAKLVGPDKSGSTGLRTAGQVLGAVAVDTWRENTDYADASLACIREARELFGNTGQVREFLAGFVVGGDMDYCETLAHIDDLMRRFSDRFGGKAALDDESRCWLVDEGLSKMKWTRDLDKEDESDDDEY